MSLSFSWGSRVSRLSLVWTLRLDDALVSGEFLGKFLLLDCFFFFYPFPGEIFGLLIVDFAVIGLGRVDRR